MADDALVTGLPDLDDDVGLAGLDTPVRVLRDGLGTGATSVKSSLGLGEPGVLRDRGFGRDGSLMLPWRLGVLLPLGDAGRSGGISDGRGSL